jgi:hypothetical protein
MIGEMNFNLGLSAIKRESKPKEDVERHLIRNGWEKTGEALGGRADYYENAGINLTVIEGPMGTLVVPSGPVRGTVYGDDVKVFSRSSSMGMGAGSGTSRSSKDENTGSQLRGSRRSEKVFQ